MSLLEATTAKFPPVKSKMLIQTIAREHWVLKYVSDQYWSQVLYERAIYGDGCALKPFPGQYKGQEICNKALKEDLYNLR